MRSYKLSSSPKLWDADEDEDAASNDLSLDKCSSMVVARGWLLEGKLIDQKWPLIFKVSIDEAIFERRKLINFSGYGRNETMQDVWLDPLEHLRRLLNVINGRQKAVERRDSLKGHETKFKPRATWKSLG
ncbi:hypothetical protein NL676_025270 [Syzygium grande]|nr:hypothetical protein NL676_025270 [Syzygium grande]